MRGIDGDRNNPATADLVRIKIWDANTKAVLYDTQPGADDLATPTTPTQGTLVIK